MTEQLANSNLSENLDIEADIETPQNDVNVEEDEEVSLNVVHSDMEPFWTLAPLKVDLTFDQGFYFFIQAMEMLRMVAGDEYVLVCGIAGPAGAGKSTLANKVGKILNAVIISADIFRSHHVQIGAADDPTSMDFEAAEKCIRELRSNGKTTISCGENDTEEVVITSSRIVIIEGNYALHSKIRSLSNLTIAMSGGVHLDLVKTICREATRSRVAKKDQVLTMTNKLFPMYKAYVEQDMKYAMMHIYSQYNPVMHLADPLYVCKFKISAVRKHWEELDSEMKALFADYFKNKATFDEDAYEDLYLHPPKYENLQASPATAHPTRQKRNWIRVRRHEGRFFLYFYQEKTGDDMNVRPTLHFEVSIQVFAGLMSLGYEIGATLHRRTLNVHKDDDLLITVEQIRELDQEWVQIKGKDRRKVLQLAQRLKVDKEHVPFSFLYLYFRSVRRRDDDKRRGSMQESALKLSSSE